MDEDIGMRKGWLFDEKIILPNETGSIEKAQNYIREVLQTYGVENRTITRALLASEGMLDTQIYNSYK